MDLRMQREIMAAVPEVRGIMGRAGADELGIDPVGLNESDMYLTFAPVEEWRPEMQEGGMPAVMDAIRQVMENVPGISFSFNQPIDMRVQEMIIGARGDVVIKVFGYSIDELNRIASEIERAVQRIPGASDVFALRNEGMKYLKVEIDRFAAGRLGINVRDATAGYRLFRRTTLEKIDLDDVSSYGYVFQADLAFRTLRAGLRVVEVPIEFVERVRGDSKMTRDVATESLRRITRWGLSERRRQLRERLSRRAA
jgi:Cu/Ag efflux pump CusA